MLLTIIAAALAGMAVPVLLSILIKLFKATIKKVLEATRKMKKTDYHSGTIWIHDKEMNEMIKNKKEDACKTTEKELLQVNDEDDKIDNAEYIVAATLDEENNIEDIRIIESNEISDKLNEIFMENNGAIYITED